METSIVTPRKWYALPSFFVLTFILTWGIWIPATLSAAGRLSGDIPVVLADIVGAWGPSLIGIILTLAYCGRAGFRQLLGWLKAWRVGFGWYLFALFWPAVHSLIVTGLAILLQDRSAPDFANPPVLTLYPAPPEVIEAGFLALLPTAIVTQIFGSSLGEELGWRGFAQAHLQQRVSALATSILVGLFWGLWHAPRFWRPGVPFNYVNFGWTVGSTVLDAVIYARLFNAPRRDNGAPTYTLVLPILLHTSQPITTLFLSRVEAPMIRTLTAATLVLIIVARTGADLRRDRAVAEATAQSALT